MRLLPMSEWHAADALVSPADTDIAMAQPDAEEDGEAEVGASASLFGAYLCWLGVKGQQGFFTSCVHSCGTMKKGWKTVK